MEIYSFANKNWTKLFKAFNIKNLASPEQALHLKKTIILASDDVAEKLDAFARKLEANEVIITRLPSNQNSHFDKNELKAIISKALGIIS